VAVESSETGQSKVLERSQMDYVVILEKGKSFGAYVPDLPGCVAVGKTKREALLTGLAPLRRARR
jgi:hypothetical protein